MLHHGVNDTTPTEKVFVKVSPTGQSHIANHIWNTSTLAWEKATGSLAGGNTVTVNNFPATQAISHASLDVALSTFSLPTDFEGGGKISVGTSAVEVTFTGQTKYIIITADIANTGTLYVGKSNVTSAGANAGFPLEAGERAMIPINDASNALYVVASVASQNFWKGALI